MRSIIFGRDAARGDRLVAWVRIVACAVALALALSSCAEDRERRAAKLQADLVAAVASGDEVTVRHLLREGAPADASDDRLVPLIMRAADDGAEGVVRALAEAGAPMDAAGNGITAYQGSVLAGRYDMAELLVALGANPNLPIEGWQPLVARAALDGNFGAVEWLLARGVPIDAENPLGEKAFHTLVKGRYGKDEDPPEDWLRILDFLVTKGLDREARDHEGITPLSRAALALDMGAYRAMRARGFDRDARDNDGRTALDLLLSAPWTYADTSVGVDDAAIRPVYRAIRLLLEDGMACDIGALFDQVKEDDPDTPFHRLVRFMQSADGKSRDELRSDVELALAVMRLLVDRGADINTPEYLQRMPAIAQMPPNGFWYREETLHSDGSLSVANALDVETTRMAFAGMLALGADVGRRFDSSIAGGPQTFPDIVINSYRDMAATLDRHDKAETGPEAWPDPASRLLWLEEMALYEGTIRILEDLDLMPPKWTSKPR